MDQSDDSGFRITGWHVLFALIGFFGIIAAVNAYMIWLAVGSFPGEKQEKSYMQGLQYNAVLEQRAAQEALGWEMILLDGRDVNRDGGELRVQLLNRGKIAVRGLDVTADIGRAVSDEQDVQLVLTEEQDGTYTAPLGTLPPGRWLCQITAVQADGTYFTADAELWLK